MEATTKPRKPSRAWVAPIVVGAVAVAGAVFGLTRKDPAKPVARVSVRCDAASDRLTGIWDVPTRTKIGARFAAAGVDATWQVVAGDLDRYAKQWSERWTAACDAPNRESALYTQRLACLETAMIALRDAAWAARDRDVAAYATAYQGTTFPDVDQCDAVSVPAP